MDEHSIQYLVAKGALACFVACSLAFPALSASLAPQAAHAESETAASASSSSSSSSSAAAEPSEEAEPSQEAQDPATPEPIEVPPATSEPEPSQEAPEAQPSAGAASSASASAAATDASQSASSASAEAAKSSQAAASQSSASSSASSSSASSSAASEPPTLDVLAVKLTAVEIEKLTETYEKAQKKVEEAEKKAAEHQKKVDALQAEIDSQQLTSDKAFRDAYVLQRDRIGILEVMLGAQTLQEFILELEYLERINKASIDEYKRLAGMKQELKVVADQLNDSKSEAEAQAALAREALRVAQDERAERAKKANATDGADWYMSEEEFVNAWKDRLDKYLAGSPLEGQGANFAKSAFRYCIDPRWSAAISTIESGKGAICIRPHNAWGWGAADSDPYNLASEWATWESAIDAHAKGLSRGYGYTVTRSGARTYCPPNWERWYDVVSSEMAKM